MFYGQGAGKLATASAVVSDVIDEAKHQNINMKTIWSAEKLDLVAKDEAKNMFFVRVSGSKADNEAKVVEAFGKVEAVDAGFADEYAFITDEITEGKYEAGAESLGNVINKIRIAM